MTMCIVGADRAEVLERARRVAGVMGGDRDPAQFLDANRATGVVGTVDEAAEKLRFLEVAGVERVFLQHLDHRDLEMVELIGRELASAA